MSDFKFDREEARKRFHELGRERERVHALLAPIQAERSALQASIRDRELELNAQVKALKAPLFELDQERAAIARALGGQTGAPPADGE
jgi:SMC interacting uncharacterized protein involved in chromosome segregation